MSVHPIRLSLPDAVFTGRARYLMDMLAEAQDEMVAALRDGDVIAGKAAARRLASVGWLFREAADRHDGTAPEPSVTNWHSTFLPADEHLTQHQTGPGASLLEDRGTGARKDRS